MATSSQSPSRFLDGPMFKRGKVVKGWTYRWFVLDRHAGLLSYYTVSGWGRFHDPRDDCILISCTGACVISACLSTYPHDAIFDHFHTFVY